MSQELDSINKPNRLLPNKLATDTMPVINTKSASILMVDDDPVNILILQALLESEGYTQLYSTTDPLAAEGLYRQHRPDLVLLDINMPKLSGFGVMEQLKAIEQEQGNYPPIMMLTAVTDRDTRLRALTAGARDFLTKPFERIEVLSRIHNILEVRCLHKQIRQHNKLLEQKVRDRTAQLAEKADELQETRLEIIRRLGRAAEYRDNETGLHIIRMSKYAQLLGQAAGMSDDAAELLLNASPMHDIGKIGIPDSILLKPGKLNAKEWEIMKTHTRMGAEILSGHPSDLMEMARLIALTHHEKWDGSGYPNGLQGEAIPLVGRIVALTDVFDALTSERPYKKAWCVGDALSEIDQRSGTHFDPQLVQQFKRILPTILILKEQYADPPKAA